MTEEDLIEHTPRSVPGIPSLADRNLSWRVIVTGLALLLVGVTAGHLTSQRDDVRLAALPPLSTELFVPFVTSEAVSFEFLFGQQRPPLLQQSDLEALGEQVQQTGVVVSGRAALPVLCQTSIGQPGTSNSATTFPLDTL